MKKTQLKLVSTLIVLIILVIQQYLQQNNPSQTVPATTPSLRAVTVTPTIPFADALGASTSADIVVVTRVVDGDTIVVSNKKTVRLIGINTPETVDPRRPTQCFGKEASEKTKELLLNKTVRLEKDVSETDKYGRLLRYVFIGNELINQTLVAEGYAQAVSYPPDVKYIPLLRETEKVARENKKGLWGVCPSGP